MPAIHPIRNLAIWLNVILLTAAAIKMGMWLCELKRMFWEGRP